MASSQDASLNLVGLVPAAGRGRRVAFLPFSKELCPVGFGEAGGEQPTPPKAVCRYLLERMQAAGVEHAYVVLRAGKWDIPAHLRDGDAVGMPLGYLLMRQSFGVPYTLDQAYPFVREARVVFGFPDILFEPEDAPTRLLDRQARTGADLVLGLFPARRSQTTDRVALDTEGRIRSILAKPSHATLQYTWIVAVWTPAFTHFMHTHLSAVPEATRAQYAAGQRELSMGEVIQAALEDDVLHVEGVRFDEGTYLDIGTPDALALAACGTWQDRVAPDEAHTGTQRAAPDPAGA